MDDGEQLIEIVLVLFRIFLSTLIKLYYIRVNLK